MKQIKQSVRDRVVNLGKIRLAGIAAGALALGLGAFGGPVGGPQSGSGLGASAAQAESPAAFGEPTLRLMSQSQYANTISRIFGADIGVRVRFAPVQRVDGLVSTGATTAVMTTGGLDPVEASARAIAAQVVDPAHRPVLIPCQPANPKAADAACARTFFGKVMPLLYRRPVGEQELTAAVTIAGRGAASAADFYEGIGNALAGILANPKFLFIQEVAEPDPDMPGGRRLTAYSKASRLSFLLWNAAPDEELLAAAGRGDLHRPADLRRQVDRMIASPLYREGVRAFFSDFLVMETFDTLSKDADAYPAMTLKAVSEAREQLLRTIVDHLVTRGGDYRDLYTTRKTFLTADLGVLYGMSINRGSQGWVPYEFPPNDPRSGILTQIGFLSQYAPSNRSSAVKRGRAVREVLLCQKVPDPPPTVDFSKFEGPMAEKATARLRLAEHSQNPVCAGCHSLTDPIGLGLENFDGAGQFRTIESNAPIVASGQLDGVPFRDAVGLGQALRDNPALKTCVVNRLYAYSVGRKITPNDEPLLQKYETALDKQGYKFDAMLRLMILEYGFFALKPATIAGTTPVTTASNGGTYADQN